MPLQEEFEVQGNFLFKYRSHFPNIILIAGILVFYLGIKTGLDPFHGIYPYICLAVSALGLIVRIITVGYTPANTSGRNTANQVADTVNQLGIYSTVRHPLYVGNFLMYLGLAMLTHNIWFVIIYILVFYLYYERIMFAEEQFLRKKFGTQYTEWASKTPAFWPRFSQFKKADLYFSWRKILKKEKNGLAAMFALFYIFFLLRNYIINGKIDSNLSFWMVSTILSLVLYLILKYLKYNSNILNEEGR